eukprot:GILI01011086.1.p1 GENE.GILI01011086.1~~GILI01011086.1.p1  ORF type:complete len:147 (+),score=32.72 GILI01011086.1:107-547(+)
MSCPSRKFIEDNVQRSTGTTIPKFVFAGNPTDLSFYDTKPMRTTMGCAADDLKPATASVPNTASARIPSDAPRKKHEPHLRDHVRELFQSVQYSKTAPTSSYAASFAYTEDFANEVDDLDHTHHFKRHTFTEYTEAVAKSRKTMRS